MAYTKVMNKVANPVIHEMKALAAITPGHLVELASGGVQVHSTAGGKALKAFAIEQGGSGFGKTIADACATNDVVPFVVARPGDIVVARLKASESVTANSTWLESQGDGTLRIVVSDTSAGTIALNSLVGIALDTSNVASVALIRVMIV